MPVVHDDWHRFSTSSSARYVALDAIIVQAAWHGIPLKKPDVTMSPLRLCRRS